MSRLRVGSGRILITDDDGITQFNTDDGLLHGVDIVNGSQLMPTINASDGQGFDLTNVWNIGSCSAGCTGVYGMARVTGWGGVTISGPGGVDSNTSIMLNAWQRVMNEHCFVLYQDGHGPIGTSPDPNLGLYQHIHFYFRVSGTAVQLVRRAWCSKASQGSISVSSCTVSFRLKAGLFT